MPHHKIGEIIMTKNNQITVNASGVFATKSTVPLNTAKSELRTSLQALNTAIGKAVSAIQVSAIALTDVVHAWSGEKGLKVVPTKPELNELLKVEIEAVAVCDDGTKNEPMAKSLASSGATICEMTWCILAGHFRVGYRPKGDNVWIDAQDKDDWKPNPNIHTKGVFCASNVPFPKFKDNGNVRTNSPEDMVPVTATNTKSTFGRYMLQKPINSEQTGFAVAERNGKVETVANSKEAMRAVLGLKSWFKNMAFVDGQVTSVLWDENELDNLCTNTLFDACNEFAQLVISARTVADAQMEEHCLKKKEAEENAKLKAEVDAKLEAEIQAEKDAKKLDKKNNPKNYLPKVYPYGDHTKGQIKAKTKEIAEEIAEINAKSANKSKANSA